ncbi:MAG: NUDIX domain-containing protein [Bacteroidales bacterium]|nr:NUDIX domain-containing protein [Bacteroidales bacterium]
MRNAKAVTFHRLVLSLEAMMKICIFSLMKEIAAIILENDKGEFLLALRDNKPSIPFPNHWDLIGGHVEEGETPEEALIREVKEELDIDIREYTFYKKFECLTGDAYDNIKYIYTGKINIPIDEITLYEGQRAQYFTREEIRDLKFANIIKSIVMDYINHSLSDK